MKILVIAAHPDDEVLGVGGTISKSVKKGDEVYVSIISEGVSAQYEDKERFLKLRRDACLNSARLLGVKEVFFHDFPDAKLENIPKPEIIKIIEEDIKKVNPQRIYTHHGSDLHKDHQIVFETTLVAARRIPEIFCYEILGTTNKKPNSERFKPNTYVDISKEIEKKLRAIGFYETETKEFPCPISLEAIKTLAKYRGVESRLNAAEAFVCVRRIEK
jgi:N-acetylglucosamine malate deacetylase 1